MMKLKITFAAAALLVGTIGLAGAKYISESLTIEGPGLSSPINIEKRHLLDRVFGTMLVGRRRIEIKRPSRPGPAYSLVHSFAIGDTDGSDVAAVHQTLYPFAAGGPVVETPHGERFDMSFGPVRFRPGWFEVPAPVLDKLQEAGLPENPPPAQGSSEPEVVPATRVRDDPPPLQWQWILGGSAAALGAGIWVASRRRHA